MIIASQYKYQGCLSEAIVMTSRTLKEESLAFNGLEGIYNTFNIFEDNQSATVCLFFKRPRSRAILTFRMRLSAGIRRPLERPRKQKTAVPRLSSNSATSHLSTTGSFEGCVTQSTARKVWPSARPAFPQG